MALDTAAKRMSAMNMGSPWRSSLPLPDATIDVGDRVTLLRLCSANSPADIAYYIPQWSVLGPFSLVQYDAVPATPTYQLHASCDVHETGKPAVYSVASGELPSGLVLTSSGVLTGAPIARAVFTVAVRCTDHLGGVTDSAAFTITVVPNPANVAASKGSLFAGFNGSWGRG